MNFEKMTDEEISVLTPGELDRIIKFRMAEGGVKFLVTPLPLQTVKPPLDDFFFQLLPFEIKSRDENILREISEFIFSKAHYLIDVERNWRFGYGSDARFVKGPLELNMSVTRENCYKASTMDAHREVMEHHKDAKERYEKDLKEFNDNEKFRIAIADEVYDRFYAAQERVSRIKKLQAVAEEYLTIAEGDASKAYLFFKKAYPLDPETEAKVVPTNWLNQAKEA